jgi:hypothetical protein
MSNVVKPGRNPIVAQAFAGLRADERAQKKKPAEPQEPAPSKKPKPQRAAKKGTR